MIFDVKQTLFRLWIVVAFSALPILGCAEQQPDKQTKNAPATVGAIFEDVPDTLDISHNFLFYLHGRIIEVRGVRPTHPEWGIYEYELILDSLKQNGFTVISEARPADTEVEAYADKVVGQIQRLLAAGVKPEQITVVGASKGAIITMQISSKLKNREVNFVTIAACNDWVFENIEFDLYGNILSIHEESDPSNGSCEAEYFKRSTGINKFKEIKVNTGLGHGVLYTPLQAWVVPVVNWARGEKE